MPIIKTRDAAKALERHHHSYFAGHEMTARQWPVGPVQTRVPGFFVHEVAPGPRAGIWTYLSVGVWSATHGNSEHGLEAGLEALEQRFDAAGIVPTDVQRPSVA